MGQEKEEKKADGRVTETDPEKKEQMKRHRERLRGRYLEQGLDSLQDYEVLELLLQFAIPYRDTKDEAKKLIAHFGSLPDVLDASYEEILNANVPRVKETAAATISEAPWTQGKPAAQCTAIRRMKACAFSASMHEERS